VLYHFFACIIFKLTLILYYAFRQDGDDGSNDEAPFGACLDVGQSGKDEDRSSP
jgi:hypothetical protein